MFVSLYSYMVSLFYIPTVEPVLKDHSGGSKTWSLKTGGL